MWCCKDKAARVKMEFLETDWKHIGAFLFIVLVYLWVMTQKEEVI